MNYVSFHFWALLACGLAGFVLLRWTGRRWWKDDWDRWYLLALSCTLFASESLLSFGIFLAVGLWVFAMVRILPRVSPRGRGVLLGLAIAVALQPLCFFKYWAPGWGGVLIPIGISFYTFQMIGLLVDSTRSGPERLRWRDFLNFASFFPQIVAGPIERKASLLPQLQGFRFCFRREDVENGLRLVVLGLFYKLVVADNLASSSGWITGRLQSPWLVHLSNLLFGLRIYFDFCGYSLIALGIGRCLGVRLTTNFLAPYTRRNIREFWRSWHISLSQWFRDYVYAPLGGNRARFPVLVLVIVFLVSGIWHGAGWNFVLWGAVHGVLFAAFHCARDRVRLPAGVSWILTFSLVMASWLFFYQRETEILGEKLGRLLAWDGYLVSPVAEVLKVAGNLGNVAYFAGAGLLGILVVGLEWVSIRRRGTPYAWGQPLAVQVLMVVLLVWATPVTDNGFVYFNF